MCYMKTQLLHTAAMAVALLFSNLLTVMGIENLQIRVQGTNAVLSWPSVEGETFIIRYRARLDEAHPWTLLAASYPAASGANQTTYIHAGIVEYPSEGSGGGGGDPPAPPMPDLPPVPWDDRYVLQPDQTAFLAQTAVSSPEIPVGAIGFYQVVRQGAHLFGMTDGIQLTDVVGLPVEAGHPEGQLLYVTVLIDDSGTEAAQMLQPPFPSPFLFFTLDTRLLGNGAHTIQAEATWMVDPNNPDPAALVKAQTPVIQFNVFNEISFPDWSFVFGELYDSMLINAVSAHLDADWEIAIFDSQNQYVGSFTGHTYDGQIQTIWNLIDPLGIRRNDPWFSADIYTSGGPGGFTASAPGGRTYSTTRMLSSQQTLMASPMASGSGASATSPTKYKSYDVWTGPGNWVVAKQQAFNGFIDHELLDQMTDNFVLAAESRGYTVYPPHPSGEAFRLHVGAPYDPVSDWNTLRMALIEPTARNFYYFGHGVTDQIGAGTNDWKRITTAQLYSALATKDLNAPTRHAYRYVFLDGCETAAGDLPLAFGIPKKKLMRLIDFLNDGRRPCAFMGWTKTKWVGYFGIYVHYPHINFVTHFKYEWIENDYQLNEAVARAANYPDASGINIGNMKIYGYNQLRYNEYNTP